MSATHSIVVIVPDDAEVLGADLLGTRAIDHLLLNLSRLEGARVNVVAAAAPANGVEAAPTSVQSCVELRALDPADSALLVLDARFWLSLKALKNLLVRAGATESGLRVVSRASSVATDPEGPTLAVCVPARMLRRGAFEGQRIDAATRPDQVLEACVRGEAIADCDAADLDAEVPPIDLAGYAGLAKLESTLVFERAVVAMGQGVRMRDPHTVYIRGELACGKNVQIDVNVVFEGSVVLGDGVTIGANSIVRNARIAERARVNPFSIVEDSDIGAGSFVGPYGRIRPGCSIGADVQVGNYVEIKSSQVGARSRINHHSFIGDAVVGESVTIGAGTITCNHDGARTHQTIIERGAYIGSGCSLIAPVRIGEAATVGAGSTISRDVPAGKLTLARQPQTTVEHWPGPRTRRAEK